MLLIWYADPELHPNARVVGRGVQNLGQNDNPGGQWGQRSIFRTTKGVHRFLELLLNNRSKLIKTDTKASWDPCFSKKRLMDLAAMV